MSLRRKWTLRADGIKVPKVEGVQSSQATGGSDMNRIVVGVDIAKRVFQLHWAEPQTGEIVAPSENHQGPQASACKTGRI